MHCCKNNLLYFIGDISKWGFYSTFIQDEYQILLKFKHSFFYIIYIWIRSILDYIAIYYQNALTPYIIVFVIKKKKILSWLLNNI